MQLRRLFVGGYQELRRPVHIVDESLMRRIEHAREQLRLQGKDVRPVRQVPRPKPPLSCMRGGPGRLEDSASDRR